MNIGKHNFLINLKQLQNIEVERDEESSDQFYEKHKEKIKLIYWLSISSIVLYTIEQVAHELAMKLGGR